MADKTKEQIIDEIVEHIQGRGGEYSEWFVGLGSGNGARTRLFKAHHVLEKGDRWIHRRAPSPEVARDIESYFLQTLSTDGEAIAHDGSADTVYAYRKAGHTRP